MYFIVCYLHTLSCQVDYNNSLTTVVFTYDLSVPFSFDFIPQDHPEGVQDYTKTWLQWEGYFYNNCFQVWHTQNTLIERTMRFVALDTSGSNYNYTQEFLGDTLCC